MPVLNYWELSIPLPAVLIITVGVYMALLGIGLWIRFCLKDRCSSDCCDCCPNISVCEQCFRLAEMCNCRLPTMRSLLADWCSVPTCAKWDWACNCQAFDCETCNCQAFDCETCNRQAYDCETCNCLCFEIRIKYKKRMEGGGLVGSQGRLSQ